MLLAYLALVTLQQSPATVTYTNFGARLERLLPELSKFCGIAVAPSKEMKDFVVILRFKDAPVKDALAKLATAARGKWEMKQGVYTLYPDVEGIEKAEAVDRAEHLAQIRRLLAAFKSHAERSPNHLRSAISQVIPFLDEEIIARAKPFETVVFSTGPQPLQHALPPAVKPIFTELLTNAGKLLSEGVVSVEDPNPGKPFKAIASVMPFGEACSPLEIGLYIYDRDGSLLLGSGYSESTFANRGHSIRDKHPGEIPLTVPRPMQDLLKFLWGKGQLMPEEELTLADPLNHDPIECQGSALVAYADKLNCQLAVSTSDSLAPSDFFYARPTDLNVKEFLNYYDAVMNGGWVVLPRPIRSCYGRFNSAESVDRHSLQQFVAAVPTLQNRDFASVIKAARLGARENRAVPQFKLVPWLDRDGIGEMFHSLATLTDDQVKTLLDGRSIQIARTSVGFKQCFLDALCDPSELSWDRTGPEPSALEKRYRRVYPSVYTELADAEIPSGSFVRLTQRQEPAYEDVSQGLRNSGHWSLQQIANAIIDHQAPTRLRLCTKHLFELRYYIAPGCYLLKTGFTYERPADSPVLTLAEFPEATKAELKRLVAAKTVADHDSHGNGGATPPR